jgi:hypothetical protein
MPARYELLFGYMHCLGQTTHSAGFVDTEDEARAWVRSMQEGTATRPRVPDNEPIRTCEASFCPLKSQQPWFSYRALS